MHAHTRTLASHSFAYLTCSHCLRLRAVMNTIVGVQGRHHICIIFTLKHFLPFFLFQVRRSKEEVSSIWMVLLNASFRLDFFSSINPVNSHLTQPWPCGSCACTACSSSTPRPRTACRWGCRCPRGQRRARCTTWSRVGRCSQARGEAHPEKLRGYF